MLIKSPNIENIKQGMLMKILCFQVEKEGIRKFKEKEVKKHFNVQIFLIRKNQSASESDQQGMLGTISKSSLHAG